MSFKKDVNTLDQSVALLEGRGLVIPEKSYAKRYLRTIGYYRLSGYFPPFYGEENKFSPGSDFRDILDLYIFDRKLRLLVMDAMERIEVAIRTVMSNDLAVTYGDPHWFLDKSVFKSWYKIDKLHAEITHYTGKGQKGQRNKACSHYYEKYSEPPYPPCWMVTETLTMGTWSVIFEALERSKVKQRICKQFGINVNDFGSWVHELTLIRNDCAHHARFWNTSHALKAKNVDKYSYTGVPLRTAYVKFVMIKVFMDQLFHNSLWAERLYSHLDTCPLDVEQHMGFPKNWKNMSFWK